MFDSLLTGSMDETAAAYGLLAEDIAVAPDRLSATFRIRPQARFHNGDPVLAWAISNVVCHRDAKDQIYPRKETEANKIDGPVAAITALGRAICEKPPERSFWELNNEKPQVARA